MSDRFYRALERHRRIQQEAQTLLPRRTDLLPIPRISRDPRSHRHLIVQLLRQRDGTRCYLCHTELDVDQSCIEHIIPISHGGTNEPHNVAIACSPCNNRKAGLFVSIDVTSGAPVYHQPRTIGG